MTNQNQGASIEAEREVIAAFKSAFHAAHRQGAGYDEAVAAGLSAARRTPAAQVGAGELPPLPMTKAQYGLDHTLSFSAIDMRNYARAAIEADRAQHAMCQPQGAIYQPSGAMCQAEWITCPKCKGNYAGIGADGVENDCAKCENGMVRVSHAAPASAQSADELDHGETVLRVQEALGITRTGWVSPDLILMRLCQLQQKAGAQPDQRESAAERYTCIGKGGEYELIGEAWPAGVLSSTLMVSTYTVYRDAKAGRIFVRTAADFAQRMEHLAASPAAQPAKDEQ